jgi:hypothetical protein
MPAMSCQMEGDGTLEEASPLKRLPHGAVPIKSLLPQGTAGP